MLQFVQQFQPIPSHTPQNAAQNATFRPRKTVWGVEMLQEKQHFTSTGPFHTHILHEMQHFRELVSYVWDEPFFAFSGLRFLASQLQKCS
ncbi:hypothetical protein IM700_002560 [Paenibacillus sp. DXFW5]|uniref:Uncharacterized protein n=1 Tax=Paenibacillus rhizolycopersici TaxID=2780073 RepID=A0ABS2GZY1_9BACL|nr:hypothetical protein [Paenibacillus rhizolycopersici]MBM6994540.1 hypothetical protein [Paenibacillus rhizolycopersici]